MDRLPSEAIASENTILDAAAPATTGVHLWQAACCSDWTEEGHRHRGSQRLGPDASVEAAGVAASRSSSAGGVIRPKLLCSSMAAPARKHSLRPASTRVMWRLPSAGDAVPPVWWTQHPSDFPVLTGWFAGPKADAVAQPAVSELVDVGLGSLAEIFNLPRDPAGDADVEKVSPQQWRSAAS